MNDYIKFKNPLATADVVDYTAETLGQKLREMYDNAEKGEKVLKIHLFGIEYGQIITSNNIRISDIISKAGLNASYITEVSKGISIGAEFQKSNAGETGIIAKTFGSNDTSCWFVGAKWDNVDMTETFISNGYWENGYDDKYIDKVNSISVGDRIAIKAVYVRKNNVPFDPRGNDVSCMGIKAIGTVTKNYNNGKRVDVDWQSVNPMKEWYFYTYFKTIWEVKPADGWMQQALIDFTFNNINQDITRFRNEPFWAERFGDDFDTDLEPVDEVEYHPYSKDELQKNSVTYTSKPATAISLKEFAIKVLEDTQKPMTDVEIWEYGIDKGWDENLNSVGKTPWQSIYAILSNYKNGSPNPDKRIKIIESEQRRQFLINYCESDKQDEETDEIAQKGLFSDDEIEEDAPINKKEIETLTLNCLGGLKKEHKILKRASLFELNNGKNVLIRQSKLLSTVYFYGLQKAIVDSDERIDYLILVKGDEGFYKFPYDLIKGLCLDGSISFAEKGKSANEAVKGYRIFLNLYNDKYMLRLSGSKSPMDIDKFFTKFQYTKEDFLTEVYFEPNDYDDIIALLERKMNIILQGAPGVGKSYMAKRLAYSIIGTKDESKVKMIQFHQNYSYEDFIEGFRPNEDGKFIIRKGIFYNFCQRAQRDISSKYFFIIDEINRGNLSKVMGELMLLLENDKRGEKFEMQLTYSGDSFYVPENVYVIGMMNTADRSLAMIDYALRRRFSFIHVEPVFDNLRFVSDFKINYTDAETVVEKIHDLNSFISENLDSGHQIGHSYFCSNSPFTQKDIEGIIKYEIEELLNEYFFDDKDNLKKAKELLK